MTQENKYVSFNKYTKCLSKLYVDTNEKLK